MVIKRPAKIITYLSALEKARKYCAYQERSQMEVRDKFFSMGISSSETEQGIAQLIEEGYINEERFAVAYARGKFRIKKWGRIKIKLALRSKHISEYCIRKALENIDRNEYLRTAKKLIKDSSSKIHESNPRKRNQMVAKTVIARGFEPDMVWEILNSDED